MSPMIAVACELFNDSKILNDDMTGKNIDYPFLIETPFIIFANRAVPDQTALVRAA